MKKFERNSCTIGIGDNTDLITIDMLFEWEKIRKRLQNSGYDLSKIIITEASREQKRGRITL